MKMKFYKKIDLKKFKKLKNRNDAGFTFVETLAALAVTALLSSTVAVSAHSFLGKARTAAARNQIEIFKVALQSYYIDCGTFPSDEQGLEALWEKPSVFPVPENWKGPYTDKKIPNDPWGSAYCYFSKNRAYGISDVPEGLPYGIYSLGSDKASGGGNDIVSWEE